MNFEVITLGNTKTVTSPSPVNHVYVVDCSGSMYHQLPSIRAHIKNAVSLIAKPNDTFSVIWFSGKLNCGIAFEGINVCEINTTKAVHAALDNFLVPISLTGFVDPIDLAMDVATRLDSSKLNSFIMLTDGYDNQSSKADIMKSVSMLPKKYDSIAFIEFGWYCDRELLQKMANITGGLHLFSEDIGKYGDVFHKVIDGSVRETLISVDVNKKATSVLYIHNNTIKIQDITNGKVSIPETVDKIYTVVPSDLFNKQVSDDRLALMAYYGLKTNDHKLANSCLLALGDVYLLDAYSNAYTKQQLSDVLALLEEFILVKNTRFIKGRVEQYKPDTTIPSIFNLLSVLTKYSCKLSLEHFAYNRTTSKRVEKDGVNHAKFISFDKTLDLNNLVFNSSRPNISIQTVQDGVVKLPDNDLGLTTVKSKQTKNYTIVRDGIYNVSTLPILFPSQDMMALIEDELKGHLYFKDVDGVTNITKQEGNMFFIDLKKYPLVTSNMVQSQSVRSFMQLAVELEVLLANQKVLNHLLKDTGVKTTLLSSQYTKEQVDYLVSLGVKDYGYAPPSETVKGTDAINVLEFNYKIKGLSSLPSIKAVDDKLNKNAKLNMGDTLIMKSLNIFDGLSVDALLLNKKNLTIHIKELQKQVAEVSYSLILGRQWFSDTPNDCDEFTIDYDLNDNDSMLFGVKSLNFTFSKKTKEVHI